MSGSSSGGGGGFSPSTPPVACESLAFDAQITSPKEAAQTVQVGDVLEVVVTTRPSINVMTAGGELVGSIIDRVTALLSCIQQDYEYEAVVTHADGGDVRVHIQIRGA